VLTPDELAAWLRLLETPGVGRDTARRLLAAFGAPEALFDAPPAALRAHVGAAVAQALATPPEGFAGRLDAARRWLDGAADRHVLALGDPRYPPALLHTADPPLLLYAAGQPEVLDGCLVAVVGSRAASPQGLRDAHRFARALGEAGVTIVSGLALGIDAAAHAGSLDGPGAGIAVVGTGLDQVYPRRHAALADRLRERGLLLSEYAPGTPPLPAHFPQRNRVIAGLSRGTLVVEAALQSGSLITARLAAEMGREVWALPGSIHAEQSRGCLALLKQGAALVETPEDILADLGLGPAPSVAASPTRRAPAPAHGGDARREPLATSTAGAEAAPERQDLPLELRVLGDQPLSLDELVDRTGTPPATLAARLLGWELEGRVARLPGGRYQRLRAG
jgi:DNA processing protein